MGWPAISVLALPNLEFAYQMAACAVSTFALTIAELHSVLNLPLLGMQVIIAAWVFALGSCFGSFLNVVIYRLPAGLSLGRPKSRCPRCETPLAARDNIPIFGWLILRGRCRYCGLPIAARYPIVETTCGIVFLVLLFGELVRGGANLPLRDPDHFHVNSGFWLVWFMKWDLAGLYLYHCFLTITVLAVCMIGFDRHLPVSRLRQFAVFVGLLCGTMWPELRPVPAWPFPQSLEQMHWGFVWTDPLISPGAKYWTGVTLTGLLDGLAGLAVGAFIGWLVVWQLHGQSESETRTSVLAIRDGFVLAGVFLGWQAVGMLAVVAIPLLFVTAFVDNSLTGDRLMRRAAPCFFGLLLAFIVSWQFLHDAKWMIGIVGWSFSPWNWRVDWLLTFGTLAIIATIGRLAIAPAKTSEAA